MCKELKKIELNYGLILAIISISTVLVVIILIRVIYRHNPHVHKLYGKEIVLFHSTQRYEKRIWRFNLIEFIKNQNNHNSGDSLEFKMVVGELSEDTLEIVKNAASSGFDEITIISGPQTFCEDRIEIYSLLDRFPSVKYHVLPIRPNKHFMIFNKSHLYIEKPHHHNETRGAVGVKTAHHELIQTYETAYNKILKYTKQLTKEKVLKQQCYR